MVIYRTTDGQPGYHQAEELDEAVRFVERLRNGDGVDGARIFKMEEVNFDFRPYFKVEIGPGGTPLEAAPAPTFAARDTGFTPEPDFEPPAFERPAFEGGAWAEPEVPAAPAAAAGLGPMSDLGLEADPVPSFVAPPSVAEHTVAEHTVAEHPMADHSVVDALPDASFDPPGLPDEEPADAGMGTRRGLFGR